MTTLRNAGSPDQLPHGLSTLVDQELRTAGQVGDRGLVYVDAEVVIKRGEDLVEGHGPFHGFTAEPIGRADDLSDFHPATGQQGTADSRPMIAAATLVDGRGSPELAPNHDGHIAVQTALPEIVE